MCRSPSVPPRSASAFSTSANVRMPTMRPWSMTTSEPMSRSAITRTASSTGPSGGVVNNVLPLILKISLTSIMASSAPVASRRLDTELRGYARHAAMATRERQVSSYDGMEPQFAAPTLALSRERTALPQRLCQRSRIDVFELAADRYAAREAAHFETACGEHLADVMRGRLALVGEVGREDHFADHAIGRALQQPIEANLLGADAVERRESPHQYEVQTVIRLRLFDHQEIRGRLDHAELGGIALGRATQRAERVFGERIAALAMPDHMRRVLERARERDRPVAIVLQQVQRHALRRLGTHSGQAAQRPRELVEARQRLACRDWSRIE